MEPSGADSVHTPFDVFRGRERRIRSMGICAVLIERVCGKRSGSCALHAERTGFEGWLRRKRELHYDVEAFWREWIGLMSANVSFSETETDTAIRELAHQRAVA